MAYKVVEGFDLSTEKFEGEYSNILSPVVIKFQKHREPEMKRAAVYGPETFTRIVESIPLLKWTTRGRRVPTTEIFRLGPEFFYKEYTLANFGLDTVDDMDMPEARIRNANLLLRLRFSIYAHLGLGDPKTFGAAQCTLKDIFAMSESSNRLEIEAKGKSIGGCFDDFKEQKADSLPDAVRLAESERIRIAAGFLTGRGAYLMGVYLPEFGAIVIMEASNDKTRSVLPSLRKFVGGMGYEWEGEGKKILLLRHVRDAHERCMAVGPKRLFELAEARMNRHFAETLAGELVPQEKSKIERAIDDCTEYLKNSGSDWNLDAITNGLAVNVGIAHLEQVHATNLVRLAKDIGSSYNLVAKGTPYVEHVAFRPNQGHEDETQPLTPANDARGNMNTRQPVAAAALR